MPGDDCDFTERPFHKPDATPQPSDIARMNANPKPVEPVLEKALAVEATSPKPDEDRGTHRLRGWFDNFHDVRLRKGD